MSDAQLSIQSTSPSETAELAETLAAELRAGDVVLLSGDIGAGKTHFARALIKHRLANAGMDEDVPSPTFTIVQTYFDGDTEIWHSDLYRLTDPLELDELGLFDAFETAISLIEWPELLGTAAPSNALAIRFVVQEDLSRVLELAGSRARWADFLQEQAATAL